MMLPRAIVSAVIESATPADQCTARFNRHSNELMLDDCQDLSPDEDASTYFGDQDDESSDSSSESIEYYTQHDTGCAYVSDSRKRGNGDGKNIPWSQQQASQEVDVNSDCDDDDDDVDESGTDSDDDIIECYDNIAASVKQMRENDGRDNNPAPKKARISYHGRSCFLCQM